MKPCEIHYTWAKNERYCDIFMFQLYAILGIIKIMILQHYYAWITCHIMYHKIKKSALFRYFDTCFMDNIEGDADKRWHDFLSMYYKDK